MSISQQLYHKLLKTFRTDPRIRPYSETTHVPKPYIGDKDFGLPRTFIFCCIDWRAQPSELLGLKPEEALTVQNAGGRVKTGLNALLYVDNFTQGQAFKDVVTIHHTDCGMSYKTEHQIHEEFKAKYPQVAPVEIDAMYFGAYDGGSDKYHESVREDIKFVKESPFVRKELKDTVVGFVYDIATGKLIPTEH